jgi:hypothetical protein
MENVSKLGSFSHFGSNSQMGSIFRGRQCGKTLPRGIKIRKLFQKANFWNSVKYSPLVKKSLSEPFDLWEKISPPVLLREENLEHKQYS